MARKFRVVATGGTFDVIHLGHIALLSKAFEIGHEVIIGVSSDEFATSRGKRLNHSYKERVTKLEELIAKRFGGVRYTIAKLDADFGPAVSSGAVDALVASSETRKKGPVLNDMRGRLGLKPVEVVSVDLVKAEDGLPISSTRIKAGEIDAAGKRIGAKSRKA